ncbi:MAG TPA: UpxY family transcription antiterminator [Candidatus Angelobacter sp.]|nr:UpxY family transcription antiterminator [Candidatus Angelobacter sp.]
MQPRWFTSTELRWFAAYVRSRHESRVAQRLTAIGVEHFLPQYKAERKWSDRSVQLMLPLFPGYIFVRTQIEKRLAVLETPGVIYLVGAREPEPLEDEEIEQLKAETKSGEARPSVYPVAGDAVRVIRGPLTGREGMLVRERGKNRVVVMVASVAKAMSVEVEMDAVTKITKNPHALGAGEPAMQQPGLRAAHGAESALARQGCVAGDPLLGDGAGGICPPRGPASSVGTPKRPVCGEESSALPG